MKNHLTLQCLHASLEGTDTNGCHLGTAPAGDMFQRKINKIFKDMPNVFGIVDDILVAEYEADGRDHDKTLQRVL